MVEEILVVAGMEAFQGEEHHLPLPLHHQYWCVCFGSKCLSFFLLRDDFESLKCCLDLWLSSMFNCIHLCFFSSLKNCFVHFSTTSSFLSTARLSIEPLDLPFLDSCYRNFNPLKFLRICLDSFLTAS